MLQAILKGKLSREQENMEDILTSNVFGLLRYVQPQEGILKYLSLAEDKDGIRPLEYLNSFNEFLQNSVEYEFWPWWQEMGCIGCEPDVVISIKIPDKKDLLILIEAKYLSGKSSEADESYDTPYDQLAREWDNLSVMADESDKSPILVYLTAHYTYPQEDINNAVSELREKRPGDAEPVIYWLSWRHLHKVCENSRTFVLDDLMCLLSRLNFKFFNGAALEYVNVPWSFEIIFDWQAIAGAQAIRWKFEN